jgi:hypothetical protein
MIKIFTVYFKGKYEPKYVTNLYRALKKYYSGQFEFICYSDTDEIEADRVIKLPENSEIKLHWHKLKFFSPLFGNQKPGDEIIVLDIDQIIVNNIDEMINWPVGDNELISYKKWWKIGDTDKGNIVKLNGGWYKFKSGSLKCVWDKFNQSPKSIEKWQSHYFDNGTVHFKYYGEQNFVEDTCIENNIKITYMPGEWICNYTNNKDLNLLYSQKYMQMFNQDHMILYKPNDVLKIVHFAGPKLNDTIHDCTDNWIKDYWQ